MYFNVVTHMLAALILIARIGDIGSTYLVTPHLTLEGNPIVRALGWKYALLTSLVCLVPYVQPLLGMTVLILSLLVTGSNLSKGWFARAVGEQAYQELLYSAARRSSLWVAIAFSLGAGAATGFAGLIMMFFLIGESPWGFWAAVGVALYGLAIALYGSISAVRVFRRAAAVGASEVGA